MVRFALVLLLLAAACSAEQPAAASTAASKDADFERKLLNEDLSKKPGPDDQATSHSYVAPLIVDVTTTNATEALEKMNAPAVAVVKVPVVMEKTPSIEAEEEAIILNGRKTGSQAVLPAPKSGVKPAAPFAGKRGPITVDDATDYPQHVAANNQVLADAAESKQELRQRIIEVRVLVRMRREWVVL